MSVKTIAGEVVAALPADAGFEDLEEFLFERAQVEEGREDCEAGRVLPARDVLGDAAADLSAVVWAQSAADLFREESDAHDDRVAFVKAVVDAACALARAESSVTLPEMGDATIRERHLAIGRRRYRVIYDTRGSTHRVLWFTNNTTCYRNVRPG